MELLTPYGTLAALFRYDDGGCRSPAGRTLGGESRLDRLPAPSRKGIEKLSDAPVRTMKRNPRLLIAIILIAVILGGAGIASYTAYRHHELSVRRSQKRAALRSAQQALTAELKNLSPPGAAAEPNEKLRIYEQGRFQAGVLAIESCQKLDKQCWLPLTAVAGKFEDEGFWFIELKWLDADFSVRGIQLENDEGVIGRLSLHELHGTERDVYQSTAFHYAMYEIQDRNGPIEMLRDYIWPKRGIIALPLDALSKHARMTLLDGAGHESESAAIFYEPQNASGTPGVKR
jgi:hypothetical protein